jgi:hypothetical protein
MSTSPVVGVPFPVQPDFTGDGSSLSSALGGAVALATRTGQENNENGRESDIRTYKWTNKNLKATCTLSSKCYLQVGRILKGGLQSLQSMIYPLL